MHAAYQPPKTQKVVLFKNHMESSPGHRGWKSLPLVSWLFTFFGKCIKTMKQVWNCQERPLSGRRQSVPLTPTVATSHWFMYSDNSNTTTVHGLEFKIHARWNSKMEPMQSSIRKQRLGLPASEIKFWRPFRNYSIPKSWSCSSWFNDLFQIIQISPLRSASS